MALPRWVLAGVVAILLPSLSAQAETNTNFNFEPNDQGWTTQTIGGVEKPWTYSNASPNKGWQAFLGVDGAQSGSYLVSPLMVLDPPTSENQKYVAVRIKHFFDFGPEADPWSLGQVQYSYAGGPWQGIRTADFDSTSSEHYAPNYSNPPSPFISLTNIPVAATPVQAWAGETNGFDDRTHRDSYFQLNYGATFTDPYPFAEGQTIQFRLLAGTLDPLLPPPGNPQLIWEVTAVEVIHAALVPEPGGIALAAVGIAAGTIGLVRRRLGRRTRVIAPRDRDVAWALSGCFCVSSLFVMVVLALVVFMPPAGAAPIQTISWDFATSDGGWTQFNTAAFTPVPTTPKWTWSGGTWTVDSAPVDSPASQFGNYLTSPLIQLSELPADKFTFNLAHRFKLPADGLVLANGAQLPVDAAQFEYSLDGAIFLPVFKTEWKASGPISPILTPYVQSATWAVPQFVPGVAPIPSLFPLIDGGASFTGESHGFSNGWFVASQAFEVDFPGETQTIQFRFTNMNLGPKCGLDAGWDIRFAQVDLVLAPEPSGLMIATLGGVAAMGAWLVRQRSARRLFTTFPQGQA